MSSPPPPPPLPSHTQPSSTTTAATMQPSTSTTTSTNAQSDAQTILTTLHQKRQRSQHLRLSRQSRTTNVRYPHPTGTGGSAKIQLGTFDTVEEARRSQEIAGLLVKHWKGMGERRPSYDWVRDELTRLGVRIVGRTGWRQHGKHGKRGRGDGDGDGSDGAAGGVSSDDKKKAEDDQDNNEKEQGSAKRKRRRKSTASGQNQPPPSSSSSPPSPPRHILPPPLITYEYDAKFYTASLGLSLSQPTNLPSLSSLSSLSSVTGLSSSRPIIISKVKTSTASSLGVLPMDVLVRVNTVSVENKTLGSVAEFIGKMPRPVMLTFRRGGILGRLEEERVDGGGESGSGAVSAAAANANTNASTGRDDDGKAGEGAAEAAEEEGTDAALATLAAAADRHDGPKQPGAAAATASGSSQEGEAIATTLPSPAFAAVIPPQTSSATIGLALRYHQYSKAQLLLDESRHHLHMARKRVDALSAQCDALEHPSFTRQIDAEWRKSFRGYLDHQVEHGKPQSSANNWVGQQRNQYRALMIRPGPGDTTATATNNSSSSTGNANNNANNNTKKKESTKKKDKSNQSTKNLHCKIGRMMLLAESGFEWEKREYHDTKNLTWEEMFAELVEYQNLNGGDCNTIPRVDGKATRLGKFIIRCRLQYKQRLSRAARDVEEARGGGTGEDGEDGETKKSGPARTPGRKGPREAKCLTDEQIEQMEAIGFRWEGPRGRKAYLEKDQKKAARSHGAAAAAAGALSIGGGAEEGGGYVDGNGGDDGGAMYGYPFDSGEMPPGGKYVPTLPPMGAMGAV